VKRLPYTLDGCLWSVFYLAVVLPLMALVQALALAASFAPIRLRSRLRAALMAERRVDVTVTIAAPARHVAKLLDEPSIRRALAQSLLDNAERLSLPPEYAQRARDELTELDTHPGQPYVPLPRWDRASWRTRLLGGLQGIPYLFEVESQSSVHSHDEERTRAHSQVRFRGLFVSLAGSLLERDTRRLMQRALLNLKRRAEMAA
jgi:hypothetical protein